MADVIRPRGLPGEHVQEAPEPLDVTQSGDAWTALQARPDLPEPSTAAERDGKPVAHSHGMSQPHVHTADDYAQHQQPIEDERVYARLPAPGAPVPATWHDGPYAAASSLRSWVELLTADVLDVSRLDRDALVRDLLGAASVLDGQHGTAGR